MTAGWLNYPVGGLDTETTGVDMENARIVTATVYYSGEAERPLRTVLINPGIPIPEAATAVHGITTEQAEDGWDPIEGVSYIARAVEWVWEHGCPIIGHNVIFDLTILDRELRRHLGRPLEITGPVIDTLVLDKAADPYRKGSRRLADACAHWGVPVAEADLHTSAGDVVAAVKLARALFLSDMSNIFNGSDLRDLYRFQVEAYRQQRISFNAYLQRQGKTPDDDNLVWPVKPYNGKVE